MPRIVLPQDLAEHAEDSAECSHISTRFGDPAALTWKQDLESLAYSGLTDMLTVTEA